MLSVTGLAAPRGKALMLCADAFKRSHVAILNAAGRTVAAELGMHIVDFETMVSQFDTASQYLAVCPQSACSSCQVSSAPCRKAAL